MSSPALKQTAGILETSIRRGERFLPDSISTALQVGSMNGAMTTMPVTLSKLINMGRTLGKYGAQGDPRWDGIVRQEKSH